MLNDDSDIACMSFRRARVDRVWLVARSAFPLGRETRDTLSAKVPVAFDLGWCQWDQDGFWLGYALGGIVRDGGRCCHGRRGWK